MKKKKNILKKEKLEKENSIQRDRRCFKRRKFFAFIRNF